MAHKRENCSVKKTGGSGWLAFLLRKSDSVNAEFNIAEEEKTNKDRFRYLCKAFSFLAELTKFYSEIATAEEHESLKKDYYYVVDNLIRHTFETVETLKEKEGCN